MLAIDDIHVYRGRTYVLKGVSLEVKAGQIVALIGANGAGKTTVLRSVSGLLRPRRGRILFQSEPGASQEITRLPAEEIVRLGITHCPEGRGIFSDLSVRENLLIGGYLRRDRLELERDYRRVCGMFPILLERDRQRAGSLSGGEQMMLALGRALMSQPRLLLLDEPSLGLAPLLVDMIFRMLTEISALGMTILLVEQNAIMGLDLAHRAYVLETGRVILSGPSSDLVRNQDVRRAYLGGK